MMYTLRTERKNDRKEHLPLTPSITSVLCISSNPQVWLGSFQYSIIRPSKTCGQMGTWELTINTRLIIQLTSQTSWIYIQKTWSIKCPLEFPWPLHSGSSLMNSYVLVGVLSHVSTHEYIHVSVHMALSQLSHVSVLHHYSNNLQGTRGNILSIPFAPLSSLHPLDSLKSSLINETMAN